MGKNRKKRVIEGRFKGLKGLKGLKGICRFSTWRQSLGSLVKFPSGNFV